MDIYQNLIFIKGEDKTQSVRFIKYEGGLCRVRYGNGEYSYSRKDVVWLHLVKEIDLQDNIVYIKNSLQEGIKKILLFEGWYKIITVKNEVKVYPLSLVQITKDLLHKEFPGLGCSCHVPLSTIVKESGSFTEEEIKYMRNPLTHVDFLIFHQLDKKPLLAIEVDGVRYHKEGSRQSERDRRKDHILQISEIPFLRIRTDESGEREMISEKLKQIEGDKK